MHTLLVTVSLLALVSGVAAQCRDIPTRKWVIKWPDFTNIILILSLLIVISDGVTSPPLRGWCQTTFTFIQLSSTAQQWILHEPAYLVGYTETHVWSDVRLLKFLDSKWLYLVCKYQSDVSIFWLFPFDIFKLVPREQIPGFIITIHPWQVRFVQSSVLRTGPI